MFERMKEGDGGSEEMIDPLFAFLTGMNNNQNSTDVRIDVAVCRRGRFFSAADAHGGEGGFAGRKKLGRAITVAW